jgi:hypothetical protein
MSSSDRELELFRQFYLGQNKYAYFLLAAAGASIGFAVNRSSGMSLSPWMTPLAISVLCWGLSFWAGSLHLRHMMSTTANSYCLLQVESGEHRALPQGSTEWERELAARGIWNAMKSNEEHSMRYARWQFNLLITGAAFFVAWHVVTLAQTPAAK